MGTHHLLMVTQLLVLLVYIQGTFGQLNSFSPQFALNSYTATAQEGSAVDSLIVTLSASDADTGPEGEVDYSIQANPWFKIDNTGDVKVKSVIDAEDPTVSEQLSYVVTATDRGTPRRSGTTTLSITIGDENENRPEFVENLYRVNIYDGDPPGTFVVQVQATDKDRDSVLKYDLPDIDDFPYFAIDENTGNVTIKQTVDYGAIVASQPNVRFIIKARVNDGKFLQFVTLLTTINRKNHFAPEFEKTVYEVSVDEGSSGIVLTTVTATDNKEEPKQTVYYGLFQPAIPGYLTVGRLNGRITLSQALDRETLSSGKIEQLITAKDDGTPQPVLTSTATLIITVNDINDNAPVYAEDTYRLVLPQEYKTSQQYSLPTATDADLGENARIVYQLSNEAQTYFTVNRDSSVVTPRADCGRECVRVEDCTLGTVTVYAFNPVLPLLNDSLQVEIVLTTPNSGSGTPSTGLPSCSDARTPNENNPVFGSNSYTGEIAENSPVNTSVIIVTATDNDFGDSGAITYTINSPYFGINKNGTVYTLQSFDYETLTDKRICVDVVATDNGLPARSATSEVCITVTNVNDNPPRFSNTIYSATVKDGDPANSHVVTLTANDADGSSNVTYEIVGPSPYFTIDATTGKITLAKTMDKGDILNGVTGEVIDLKVKANNGRFSAETTLKVTIESSNKFAPVFAETVINRTIAEGQIGVILTVTATDQDTPKQTIRYQIASSAFNGIFSVDSASGAFRVTSNIDRENLPSVLGTGVVSVQVLAIDNGLPQPQTATASVNIEITDINDNVPNFGQTSYEIRLFDDFTPGQVFQLPDATDQDIGTNARIMYEVSADARSTFTVVGNTLNTSRTCDKSCVKIQDCALQSFSVWAYNPDKAQDRNELKVYVSLLKRGSTRPAGASPTALPSCSSLATPNNNDPKFTKDLYQGNVTEGVTPNTVVLTVNTTDDDWGTSGQVTYTITNSTLFTINDNGQISTTRDLDYENPGDRRTCMQVVATDKGTPTRSSSAVVCLDLINVNDHRPTFTSQQFTALVKDRDPLGTFVAQVSATDSDAGATVTYGFPQTNQYFQIDAISGNVTVKNTINRAAILQTFPNSIVTISVTATDGLFSATAELKVTIQAVNHFAPKFTQTVYKADINEGVSNVVVARPTANDDDVPKQQIVYSIFNSTLPNIFSIDSTSGQIRLVQALDRESLSQGFVEAVILARDSGQPPPKRTATATLSLQVNDINDNIPQFPSDSYDLNIFQNFSSGQSFALPKATDPDVSDTIVYQLSDNAKQFFTLDPATGVVTTRTNCGASCVKLADCEYMTFTLSAFNPGTPQQRDTLSVKLSLLTMSSTRTPTSAVTSCSNTNSPNNNDPKFTKDLYEDSVTEGVGPNTVVFTVNSTDEDWGTSGQVTYTITNSTLFTINDNGEISTTRDLDYENPADRRTCMQVVATDKGTPPRSASTVVCLDLINANDHRPIFTSQSFAGVVNDRDAPDTFVAQISAADNDVGATVNYSFPQVNEYFQIDTNSGNVTVKKTINRAAILQAFPNSIVTISVTATDGQFPATTELRVTIQAVNHYAPEFSQTVYNADVNEGVSSVVVARPTASDNDLPKQLITYSIFNSTIPNIFSIDPSNGQIRLVQALDRESLSQGFVEAVILARDSGQPPPQRTATATLRLQVNDINDNTPQFPTDSYDLSIFQNFTSGQSFALPKATDPDISDTIVYQLSDNAKQFFTLDPSTGVVTTRTDCGPSCVKLADCEYMTFTVSASNPGTPQQRDALAVKLTLLSLSNIRTPASALRPCSDTNSPNNNDPKFNKDLYEGSVKEGVPPSTVVLIVNTTDGDWGSSGQVTYTITNTTLFTINDNGQISTTRDLDFENPADRRTCMQVVATDKGIPPRSSSAVVCLNLINVNDHRPTFTSQQFTALVKDRDPIGTFVAQVSATDSDAGSTVTYDFPLTNQYFQIDLNSGNVTVKKTINRAVILQAFPNSIVTINVRATDGQFPVTTQLMVTIQAVNHFAPEFTQTVYNAEINEGISNVVVARPTANDDDLPPQQITYSIFNSTLPNIFSIDQSTGQISIVQALDRESLSEGFVEALILARDTAQPPPQRTATATLRLQVNDINDNTPQFPADSYDLNIFQNYTSGQSFALPKATDPDVSDTIVYELSDNAKQFFTLDPATGVVTTRTDCGASCVKLADCEYMTFTLSAYNPGASQQRDSLTVKLTLLSLSNTRTPAAAVRSCFDTNSPNDHDPKFSDDLYQGSVEEGIPPNTVVLTVNTTDEDWGNSGQVIYTITNSTLFNINVNGEISTTRYLDYENPADRQTCMQVVATDKGTPPRSASTVVCLDVININDHRPVFTSQLFSGVVNDRAPPDTFVIQISARDSDIGSTLVYDFPFNSEYFQIDRNSGNVTVKKTIDREAIIQSVSSAVVNTQVRVGDGKFLEITQLRVSVQAVNHFTPEFTQAVYNADINEGIANILVVQVSANDNDVPRQPITYSIYNSTTPNIFTISPTSGQIRLVQALDRESLSQGFVEAVIFARDNGQPPPQRTATATLRLQVNDINDNTPQFPIDSYDLNIFQNFSSGQSFALPKATDPDVSDTIVYELSDNTKQFFTLNPATGVVTTRTDCGASCVKLADCDYMTFTLWAYNPGTPQQRDALTVKLTLLSVSNTRTPTAAVRPCSDTNSPNNNDPKFTKDLYEGSVTEGVPPNTVVLTVNTTDEDWGNSGQVTYSITNSTLFTISDNGQISTTRDLDYENPADRRTCVQVVATDKGIPPRSASTVVCLDVLNKNEHGPIFGPGTVTASVRDGDVVGTFVVRLVASDRDSGATITYELVGQNDFFQIDTASGNVTVKKAIDRDQIVQTTGSDVLTLTVRASDGQFQATTQVQVVIQKNNNFPPKFGQDVFPVSVTEETVVNPLITLTASDKDSSAEKITYRIVNNTSIFSIDQTSGTIRMNSAIDRETLSSGVFNLIVVATDSGIPPPTRSSTATVRITVTDVNDNPPAFNTTLYDIQIYQNFTSGTEYLIPTASDPDADSSIVYIIDPTDPLFEVDPNTGKLRVRDGCGENCTKIEDCFYGEVTVWAYNPDRPSIRDSMRVRINMLTTSPEKIVSSSDVLPPCSDAKVPNKYKPTFDKPVYVTNVPEDEKENTVIITVSATDRDWGDSGQLDYSITNSTDFGINENGQVYIAKPLDHELNKRICMQVVATDRGTPPRSASTVVCVDITNVNDNTPVFEAFGQATVQDGAQPGTWVVKVTARDADPGSTITYDFETPNRYFQIDPTSGNITVSATISRADIIAARGADIVPLRVRASDSLNTKTTVLRVRISAMNEHAPKFSRNLYEASVEEETSNVFVTTVVASDDDIPKTSVDLHLKSSNFSEYFKIDKISGDITLIKSIDRESLDGDTIQLVVVAVDSGNPPPKKSSSATVLVRINDINDNSPYFTTDFTEIRILQNFTAGTTRQLPLALDADVGRNARTGYQLSQGADIYFNLDENTNMLTTKRNCPDCIKNGDYQWLVFTVTAFNKDRPGLRANLQVTVILLDIGNNVEEPNVGERVYRETVYVNRATAKVSQAVFVMADVTGEVATNYTLIGDNVTLSMFAVTDEGVLVLSDIPSANQKTFSLKVNAYKAGLSPKNMTLNLLVTFTDDPYLDEKGIAAISAICAIALLIIILVIVHIVWWKTRHKKDKDEVMLEEEGPCRGCCCGKPLIAVPIKFTGESSL